MKISNFVPLIWKNSFRNRRRSVLTIASLALSLCLLGLLLAMYQALFYGPDPTPAQAVRLVVRNKVSLAQPMPLSHEQKIRQVSGVEAVMLQQWFGGTYRDARDPNNMFARFAVQPAELFKIFAEYSLPESELKAFVGERTACVASRTLADKFGWKTGERITIVGDIFPVTAELKLAGIYDDPNENEVLYFHWEYLRESLRPVFGGEMDMVSQFILKADSPDNVPKIGREVDEMFAITPFQTKTETEQAFVLSFVSFLGNLKLFMLVIGGAVTFTILLVSANTLSMSVRERIREVGIMKTLGFTPGIILGTLLGEASLMAVTGGVIGCVLAWALCVVISNAPIPFAQLRALAMSPAAIAICLAIALLIGLGSALIPALSASRRPILDSLGHTG